MRWIKKIIIPSLKKKKKIIIYTKESCERDQKVSEDDA